MESVFGKRHLVCDGPLNGSYVKAQRRYIFGDDDEVAMVNDDGRLHECWEEYELGEWPSGERVWLHRHVPIALMPGVQEEHPNAVASYWQDFQGQITWGEPYYGKSSSLPERIREAVMDAEVR